MSVATYVDLLSVAEVADRLGVSTETVRRWIRCGDLGAVRLGSGSHAPVRVTDVALASFVRADARSGASRELELGNRDDDGAGGGRSGIAAGLRSLAKGSR